jgi:hypothetical protein
MHEEDSHKLSEEIRGVERELRQEILASRREARADFRSLCVAIFMAMEATIILGFVVMALAFDTH